MKKLYTRIKKTAIDYLDDVYAWEAPDRLWQEKGKAWYVTYSFFFIVIIAIGALLGEYIFIIAIIAFAFLWFVQGATPPEVYQHSINSIGIKTFEHLYKWEHISCFWISRKKDDFFLNLDITDQAVTSSMRRLTLLLPGENQDKEIFFLLIKHLDYGKKSQISANILSSMLHGQYIPVKHYLPDKLIESS